MINYAMEGRDMQQQPQIYKREEMIKVSSLAKRWGRSRQHIYNMIDKGDLPAFRFGGCRGMWVPLPVVRAYESSSAVDPNR
jgi:predicted DNA-binding transcriptional regulator AlpA